MSKSVMQRLCWLCLWLHEVIGEYVVCIFVFFFFKQKTAYEMLRSLVGSEMCIRDRPSPGRAYRHAAIRQSACRLPAADGVADGLHWRAGCLLYTSDAADDLLCVDLGGRRIIKKKNTLSINS